MNGYIQRRGTNDWQFDPLDGYLDPSRCAATCRMWNVVIVRDQKIPASSPAASVIAQFSDDCRSL